MKVEMEINNKKLEKVLHQKKIEQSRVGGFGGSDAKMFYKIGLNGLSALSNTDKLRIRVAKGIDEYKPIMQTEAMQKGHDFEDWWADWFGGAFRGFTREHRVEPDVKMARNFNVFAHADFYSIEDRRAIELKCVSELTAHM